MMEQELTYYLYKIENKLNGKLYIGITFRPNERKATHFRESTWHDEKYKDAPLYRAMKLYGKENFEFKILAQTKNPNKIAELETRSIAKCENELGLKVYNLSKTTNYNYFNIPSVPVDIYNLDGEFIGSYDSISKASNLTGLAVSKMSICRRSGRPTSGHFIMNKGEKPTDEMLNRKYLHTEIYSYDFETEQLSETDGSIRPNKRRVIDNKLMLWKFEIQMLDELIEEYDKRVFGKNISTGEIVIAKTMDDMKKKLKIESSNIHRSVQSEDIGARGWVFQYGGNLEALEEKRTKADKRVVLIEGNQEIIFEKAVRVAEYLGINASMVTLILQGKRKQRDEYKIYRINDLNVSKL